MPTLTTLAALLLGGLLATAPAALAKDGSPGWIARALQDERAVRLAAKPAAPPACGRRLVAVRHEHAMRRELRRLRVSRDRRALRGNVRLERAARRHSLRLVTRNLFEHSVRLPFARIRAGGQNLARTRSARQAVRMMMRSPSHRRTLLDRRWRYVGVGAAADCRGMVVFTVNFITGAARR